MWEGVYILKGVVRASPIRKLSMAERLGVPAGTWVAVLRGLNPATPPDRVRLIASTLAPVKVRLLLPRPLCSTPSHLQLVTQPEPGTMWIEFHNPAHAGLYMQSYNGFAPCLAPFPLSSPQCPTSSLGGD